MGSYDENGTHILLLSLGPVQDFIASARRCQDLWYGSYLLSRVSRASAKKVEEVCGKQALIFPGELGSENNAVANKILARVEGRSLGQKAARLAKEASNDCLHMLADDAWSHLEETDYSHLFLSDVARDQLDELMEYFWVLVPENGSYPEALARADQLLAARKATRDWEYQSSSDSGAGVPKSSLDGSRESVIHERAYEENTPEDLRNFFGLRSASERLCGVALLKRLGALSEDDLSSTHPAFHSTTHLAASPLLTRIERINEESCNEQISQFVESCQGTRIRTGNRTHSTLRPPLGLFDESCTSLKVPRTFDQVGDHGVDGSLFFEERILADGFGVLGDGEQCAENLRALNKRLNLPSPVPYYVMMLADGDRLGATIKSLGKEENGWGKHVELSRSLDRFASKARDIVEDHSGSLVYSGGDDVLALLPLHTALDCAESLRTSFSEIMRESSGLDAPPTLSAGLAIAHHLTPMDKVRQLAKKAEAIAKDEAGRDALAVVMDKRAGRTLSVFEKWDNGLHERLMKWAQLIHRLDLPNGVAFELERLITVFEKPLPGAESTAKSNSGERESLVALAKQIIGRKRSSGGSEALNEETTSLLIGYFEGSDEPGSAILKLSAEIQIARLILESLKVAWGPISQGGGDA